MSELIISILIGILGHNLEIPIRQYFDGDDDGIKLASYTIGSLLILIAFAGMSFTVFHRKIALQACGVLCASIIGVGSGVFLAHIADGVMK